MAKHKGSNKPSQRPSGAAAVAAPQMVDPLGREQIKGLLVRLGLPLLAIWLVGALVAGYARTTFWQSIALGVPTLLTLAAAGLVVWALGQARKARGVAGLLSKAETKDERQAALL